MKKWISGGIGLTSSLLYTIPAMAAPTIPQPGAEDLTACPTGSRFANLCIGASKTGDLIGALIALIFVLAALLALGYLIWGGIKWLISGGDKAALEEARNHIIAAIIGLIIIFLSFFILNIVLGFFLPGFSLFNFEIPALNI